MWVDDVYEKNIETFSSDDMRVKETKKSCVWC